MSGAASPNRIGGADGGTDQHGRAARGDGGGGGTLPVRRGGARRGGFSTSCAQRRAGIASTRCERCGDAGLAADGEARRQRRRTYDGAIKDALTALWEASDRVCGKRLVVMIPTLLPALERHGRLKLGEGERAAVAVGQRGDDRPAARRREGRGSGRPAPSCRLLLGDPARGADPDLQRLEEPAAGLLRDRHGRARRHERRGLVHPDADDGGRRDGLDRVPAAGDARRQPRGRGDETGAEPVPLADAGADFDNDSAFMNDVVVPWCRAQKIEVTRSRAYKKNDQAFVEQKNGAVVRRLVGYGRFDGVETARVMARLYAAARLHVNFFQPSFKLKEKRREGREGDQALSCSGDAV